MVRAHASGALSALITPGIQRKLIFSFVPLILVVIALLSFVLMRDFSSTILASVIQNGKALAERTASVIKANTGEIIGTDDYLSFEGKANADAEFPFRAISFWQRNPKGDSFTVAASTNRTLVGGISTGNTQAFTEAVYRRQSACVMLTRKQTCPSLDLESCNLRRSRKV